jgi:nucleoside-diphosphate-sugar epimerase
MVGKMKIFCTGAAGYIGGSVAANLIAAGHQVTGLVRSAQKADAVRARGIEPLLGTLDDAEILVRAAQAADVVVNAASADHRGSAVAMLDALAGSGKTLIHTSGSSIVGTRARGERTDAVFDEDTPITPSPARAARVALNELILSYRDKGCRPVIICPSLIYGLGHGANPDSVQVPLLIKLAGKRGNAAHAGPGENVWSNVHIDDLVPLYALAIEKAPAGAFYFAENGEHSRGVRGDQPHARLCRTAIGDVDAGGRRRMGRGHRARYDGLEQPRAGKARAAGTRLEAEGARPDRGDRARLLSGVGERIVARKVPAMPSSLRTQGPIRRGPSISNCCPTILRNNDALWLWVPAFAGTTCAAGRRCF